MIRRSGPQRPSKVPKDAPPPDRGRPGDNRGPADTRPPTRGTPPPPTRK